MEPPKFLQPSAFILIVIATAWGGIAIAEEHEDHEHHDEHEHHEDAHHEDHDDHEGAINWATGEGVNIGGFLFPELFANGVFGDSTTDPALLASGDHDPQTQATLQSLHVSSFLRLGDRISGFANYEGSTDANGDYSGRLEEGFLHIEVVDGIKAGGGQFLNSFGFQNERHVHAWDFVDQYLVNGRILNEGELTTVGGEVILELPTPWRSTLTLGGGGTASHGHAEGEEEHGHGEGEFEADGANFDAWVLSGNYRADYGDHEAMAGTASFAIGENGFGETTQVYGLGHEILWNRHRDHDPKTVIEALGDTSFNSFGAGSLRWRTEAMFRNIEAISGGEADEHGHDDDHEEEGHESGEGRRATLDEFGIYTMLQYGICDWANAAFRAEWVSGIDEMGLDERWRLSPALTTYINPRRTIQARLQYNYDYGDRFGSEHSIWFQIGILWSGAPRDHGHEH